MSLNVKNNNNKKKCCLKNKKRWMHLKQFTKCFIHLPTAFIYILNLFLSVWIKIYFFFFKLVTFILLKHS